MSLFLPKFLHFLARIDIDFDCGLAVVKILKVESSPDRTSFEIELRRNCRGKLYRAIVQKKTRKGSFATNYKVDEKQKTFRKMFVKIIF